MSDGLAAILKELIVIERPLKNMCGLCITIYNIFNCTDILCISSSGIWNKLIIKKVEILLAEVLLVVDLDIHVLNRSKENVDTTGARNELEDVVLLFVNRLKLVCRDFLLDSSRRLNEDLDVSNCNNILSVHEGHAHNRSTSDSGGSISAEHLRSEHTVLNGSEVSLIRYRSTDLVVLYKLELPVKAEFLKLSALKLNAFIIIKDVSGYDRLKIK